MNIVIWWFSSPRVQQLAFIHQQEWSAAAAAADSAELFLALQPKTFSKKNIVSIENPPNDVFNLHFFAHDAFVSVEFRNAETQNSELESA